MPGYIDTTTEAGARAARRLTDDTIVWMTTVAPDGTPQTSPVWFWWDGADFWVWSMESSRVRNVVRNPRVSMHLDGNGEGGDIVIAEGTARIDSQGPSASEVPRYVERYQPKMDEYGWTWEWFTSKYPVPIRITATDFRYW